MKNYSSWISVCLLGLLAASVATFCDAIHVVTGTLSYPQPLWFGQAAWVFPLFFLAFVSMAVAYIALAKTLAGPLGLELSSSPGSYRQMVEAILTFAFCYLLSGFGNESPQFLGWVFYAGFMLRLLFTYERVFLLLLALLLAGGGMLVEGGLGALSMVAYREPEIFHVPWWLGGLYAHGAFALREGVRALVLRKD